MTKCWPPFEKPAEDEGDERVRGDGEDEEEEGGKDEMLGELYLLQKKKKKMSSVSC